MSFRKGILCCFSILFMAITCLSFNIVTSAKTIKKELPRNVTVVRHQNRELKIKWSKVKGADGYRVYRYNNKKRKYVNIKTIYSNRKTNWTDKKLKLHEVYKYRVASFKIYNGRKKISKKSYCVSARTYGDKSKLVNAEQIDIVENNPICVGICSTTKIETIILADKNVKNKKARPFSKRVRWKSSDKSLLRVNKDGRISSFGKEGKCYLFVIAHNGKMKKVKINIINYANPKSFPNYKGNNVYINDLLMNYREQICNIATYFTKYAKAKTSGIIKCEENGNINGMPQIENISTIKDDIDKILTEFPLVMKIYYSDQGVRFRMNYDASGNSYCEVTYSKWDTCEDSPLKIAPHWIAKQFLGKNKSLINLTE